MAGVVAFVRGIGNLVLIMSRRWLLRNKSRRCRGGVIGVSHFLGLAAAFAAIEVARGNAGIMSRWCLLQV